MNKRSLSLVIIVSVLSLSLTASTAFAGKAQHDRWKGVAIGVGAVILGSAIWDHHRHYPPRAPEYYKAPARRSEKYRSHRKGHWKIEKEWASPTYRDVWNPGHYNRRDKWVDGAWIKIETKPGYWTKTRVWVSSRSNRHRRR